MAFGALLAPTPAAAAGQQPPGGSGGSARANNGGLPPSVSHASPPRTTTASATDAVENSAPLPVGAVPRQAADDGEGALGEHADGTSPRSSDATVATTTATVTAPTTASPKVSAASLAAVSTAAQAAQQQPRPRVSTSVIATRYSLAVGLAGDGPSGRMVLTINSWSSTDASVDVLGAHMTALKAHLLSHEPFVSRLRAMGRPRICVIANVAEALASPWTHALTGFRIAGYVGRGHRSDRGSGGGGVSGGVGGEDGSWVSTERRVQLQWMWGLEEGGGAGGVAL